MQAYTHVIAGAFIEYGARRGLRSRPLAVLATAVAGPVSHIVLDALSILTYHPASASWDDPAWVSIHALGYALAIFLAVKLRRFWFGIGMALLPDLDWVVRALSSPPLWRPGALHAWFAALPGLWEVCRACEALPNLRALPLAAVPELLVGIAAAIHVSRSSPYSWKC